MDKQLKIVPTSYQPLVEQTKKVSSYVSDQHKKLKDFVKENPSHPYAIAIVKTNQFFADSSPHRLLLLLMSACLVFLFLWAYFGKIDQQVRGQGSIVPSGQAKIVQHLEGGIVSSILVEEGQKVEVGEPLFRISNQQAESDTQELQLQVAAIQLQVRRLEAERDEKSAPDFTGLETLVRPEALINERQLFNAHMENFKDNLNILEDQVHQKELKLEELTTQVRNLTSEMKVASDQYAINEKLRQAGAISETRYLQSKSTLEDFNTRTGTIEKSIPVTEAELNEIRSRESEMQQKHKSDVLDELKKTQLTLAQLDERIKTPEDKIRRTTVTSPIRGIINTLYITTVGGVVKPGDKLVEIVPVDDKLIVEARVPTKDRGLIWQGLPALVKISAYDYSLYGGLQGTVTEISPDTLADEHGNPYYRIRVSLPTNKLKDNLLLFPGMSADVNILSGKVTIFQYLLRPIWKISANALREAM